MLWFKRNPKKIVNFGRTRLEIIYKEFKEPFSNLFLCQEILPKNASSLSSPDKNGDFVIGELACIGDEQRKLFFERYAPNTTHNFSYDREYVLKVIDLKKFPNRIWVLFKKSPLMIGPFEIHVKSGEGAMAKVFKAKDTRCGKIVGIKELQDLGRDATMAIQRMELEGRILEHIRHPNILRVHGSLDVDNHMYLVMDYITGESVLELIKKGPVQAKMALNILIQIASALDHIHNLKTPIIHRDVKPGNIMLTGGEQRAKLVDFGIAKIIRDSEVPYQTIGTAFSANSITMAGKIVGTPKYMPPEIVKYLNKKEDPPANVQWDIFSLGITFAQMILGRHPFHFKGNDLISIFGAISQTEPQLLQRDNMMSAMLNQLINNMIAKNPNQRFHKMQEVIVQAKQILRDMRGNTRAIKIQLGQLKTTEEETQAKPADTDTVQTSKPTRSYWGCLTSLAVLSAAVYGLRFLPSTWLKVIGEFLSTLSEIIQSW